MDNWLFLFILPFATILPSGILENVVLMNVTAPRIKCARSQVNSFVLFQSV